MKFKITSSIVFTQILILCFSIDCLSQTNRSYSPAKWENYIVKDVKAAFLMPRLPIVVNESNPCRGEATLAYGSYTDGTAYVVRITTKIEPPEYCAEKRSFDRANFENRVNALKSSAFALTEREKKSANEFVLVGNKRIYKLSYDSKNERWFELQAVGADDLKAEVKTFLASLKTGKSAAGVEIGEGAEQTLGDPPVESLTGKPEPVKIKPAESTVAQQKTEEKKTEENGGQGSGRGTGRGTGQGDGLSAETLKIEVPSNKGPTEGVQIVLKPRANYTDAARTNQTQGKVLLRVTFSANGSIGGISVISGLANGLTEQSIAAVRRMLFVPASRGGVRYSVTKPVEYTFTIY